MKTEKIHQGIDSWDIPSPSDFSCSELAEHEANLRAEYERLESLASSFFKRAQAVKAEMELAQAERLERGKAQAMVTRVSGRRHKTTGQRTEAQRIFEETLRKLQAGWRPGQAETN